MLLNFSLKSETKKKKKKNLNYSDLGFKHSILLLWHSLKETKPKCFIQQFLSVVALSMLKWLGFTLLFKD